MSKCGKKKWHITDKLNQNDMNEKMNDINIEDSVTTIIRKQP